MKKSIVFWLGTIVLVFALTVLFGMIWTMVTAGTEFMMHGPFIVFGAGCVALALIGIFMIITEHES